MVCADQPVANWRNEAARFAPDLAVLVAARHRPRTSCFAEIGAHDLVLTTYALLPRDTELLLEHELHMVVLDEAQAIKNPATKLARDRAASCERRAPAVR